MADVAEGNSTDRHGSGDGGTAAKADVTEGLFRQFLVLAQSEFEMQTVPKVADWNPSVTRYYVPCDTVSPAGSVGASASQRSPPETRTLKGRL